MSEKTSYVTFYPNTNVDYIKIVNTSDITKEEMEAQKTIMKTDTVLMTKFRDRQVDASYFSMLDTSYKSVFTIYKKTPNQNYYQYLCSLSDKNYQFTDYNVVGNQFYHYLASVELADTADNGGIGYMIYENLDVDDNKNYMHVVFDEWSICDIVETAETGIYAKSGRVWSLGLNIEGESVAQNISLTSWDTLGKYPKFSKGKKNYKSMSFTGLLGKMQEYDRYSYEANTNVNSSNASSNRTYQYTEKLENYNMNASNNGSTLADERWGIWDPYAREADKLAAWQQFITDGELKLLKDIKGNSWIIQVTDSINSSINTAAMGQPTTISFQWKEAFDVSDVSIIIYGDNTDTEE